jgi:hypothetical protein
VPGSLERCDHPIQRIVLAEEKDLVLPMEVVVEVCWRKVRSRRNVTHPGFCKSLGSKLLSRGAQDLEAPRKIASPKTAIGLTLDSAAWQQNSPQLERDYSLQVPWPSFPVNRY